ncbi:MAG: hypothetical protein DRP68_02735 [Candidatus Omnitrophota bacterium]|nr:MAG: hypothetical protein DRP68_02735 [Candidatus Omnitrophota bacterium]
MLFIKILQDRPIRYYPDIAKALGSVKAGVFISQILYWTGKGKIKEGWIYKTQNEMYEETALSRREQENARKIARKLSILEEKKEGIPQRLYFRINFEKLGEVLLSYYQNNKNAQNRHTCLFRKNKQYAPKEHSLYSKNTQENTQKNKLYLKKKALLKAFKKIGVSQNIIDNYK